jgi:hypothetical protein
MVGALVIATVINVVPSLTPCTKPLASTVATPGVLDAQVKSDAGGIKGASPLSRIAYTINCRVLVVVARVKSPPLMASATTPDSHDALSIISITFAYTASDVQAADSVSTKLYATPLSGVFETPKICYFYDLNYLRRVVFSYYFSNFMIHYIWSSDCIFICFHRGRLQDICYHIPPAVSRGFAFPQSSYGLFHVWSLTVIAFY